MFEILNSNLQNFTRNLRSYTHAQLLLFFTSLSPLFIGTILFHYMDTELRVPLDEILRVSATYAMIPLFLDVPMGMVADRCGVKKALYGGLSCYFLSICSILFLKSPWSYHLYFFFSKLGVPCISGADFSLIKQQITGEEENSFKNTIYYLQKWSYLINASISAITPLAYFFNKKLPFILQLCLIIFSILNLKAMRETRSKIRHKRKRFLSDFTLCIRLCTLNRRYLVLLICAAVFGLGVTLTQTVIQHQLTQFVSIDIYYGLIFATSNIFSALGTTVLAGYLKNLAFNQQILFLLALDIFAFLALGSDHIYAVVGGFFAVNLFKGGFRPLLNAELTNKMPFQRLTAQALSLTSFITALFINIAQWLLAGQYKSGSTGHFIYAALALTCVLSCLIYSSFPFKWTVYERKFRQNSRKSQLICSNGTYQTVQIYSEHEKELIADIVLASKKQILPTALSTSFAQNGGFAVHTTYLSDVRLSDLKDATRQFALYYTFLSARKEHLIFERSANLPPSEAIFSKEVGSSLIRGRKNQNQEIDVHGWLEPNNLVICGNQLYAINWNRCGKGAWWWDLLVLLTHPYLQSPLSERVKVFKQLAFFIPLESCGKIFEEFIHFKIENLSISQNSKDFELSKRYAKLLTFDK